MLIEQVIGVPGTLLYRGKNMLTNLPEYSIMLGSHNFYCKLIYHHVIYTLVFYMFHASKLDQF